jgi:diguanylate cyclase (GGDEF)-like protein
MSAFSDELRPSRMLDAVRAASNAASAGSLQAASAYAVDALADALERTCAIRAHDAAGARVVAISGDTHSASPDESDLLLPLGEAGGLTLQLWIDQPADTEDRVLHAALAATLGTALRSAAANESRAADTARARRVDGIAQAVLVANDGNTLHRVIVEQMAQAVGAEIGALALNIAAENALAVTATYGYPSVVVEDVRIAPGEGVIGHVFASGQPLLEASVSRRSSHARRRRYRSDSCVALPLTGIDGVAAVVALTDKNGTGTFDEQDLALLARMSVPAALALAREQLRDRTVDLAHLATVDGLTGLFNRRYFETRLEQEIQRQRRQFDELALLLVDLDNFKELNDTQGHLVGDRVLREVADILRRAVRIFDVCARYGGEEFVILMPGASAPTALRIAERIRRQVELHFASGLRSAAPVSVTVSVGVSTAAPTTSRETLIAQADSALLWAKASGKNVVNIYPALTTS